MPKPETGLRAAECARRLGISIKALRLYEAHGLVRAERTAAGWRVYGPTQIARLHQIIALKGFGFSLGRIGDLLSGELPDLARFFELHEHWLHQESRRIDTALRLLAAARGRLVQYGTLSPDDLMNLTKDLTMTERRKDDLATLCDAIAARHLTPADRAALAANGHHGLDKPDDTWGPLHAEACDLMKIGQPDTPAAMDLARRWMDKVFEATGGDAALTQKLKTVARETHAQPRYAAVSTGSNAMMDFIANAYGAAIAAGIMPAPRTGQ